jgi:class 3 adenylate cyclase/tetratricopeptide (TPR) repeat protein
MQCPRCHAENREGRRFCGECGQSLASTCPSCGFLNEGSEKFCGGCGRSLASSPAGTEPKFNSPQAYTPKHLAEKILTSKSALEGERKRVTVLFADLKGSMELLADRDPEEARKLLDPVLEHMMEAVHRYEGTVNQVMGDGIMALFGAPLAHEDHAVRACYAALRMQESVKRHAEGVFRSHGVLIQIRVGLNSGDVVVRAIGSDLHMDYSAVGQTTHLAARMEQLAAPGTVLLAPATLQLVEGYVQVTPRGLVAVKGLPDPLDVYELTGASAARSRLQASAARGFTRFVGRDAEMSELKRAAEETRRGRGQIVAVVGEPGVGKSRLFYEFIHSHHTHGWLTLESESVSYGKATPYLPLSDLLRAYFHIDTSDDVRAIRAKVIGNLLTLDEALKDAIPAVLWLLDAPPEGSPFLHLEPAERRRRTLTALRTILLKESRVRPIVVVFEDLHWIDSETQDFLDNFVESLPSAPILLAVNYRPEYQHRWGSKTYYRQLRVDPLPPESAEDLLGALLGADPSVRGLIPFLIDRTEGNPLFLEESVRALAETGTLAGSRGAYSLVKLLDSITVPANVQAILAARIDRLTAADKGLLQAAAVVGKDVPFALLLAVADLDEDGLRRGLGRLQAAEFLYEARLFPELEFTFKHALTHEVAYATLLGGRRSGLHAALVGAIERLYADRLDEHVEQLAHHAFRGELRSRSAARYLRWAGERAAGRSASREAAMFFEQAIPVLNELPGTPETLTETADVHLALATTLIGIKGTGSPDVEASHMRARDLAERLGDPIRLYQALWGLWYVNFGRGRYEAARGLGEQLLSIAERANDTGRLLEAHHSLWPTLSSMGESLAALPHLAQGLALYDPGQHASQAFLYGGHDAGVCCRYHLARAQWFLGYPERALAKAHEALALADTLAHPPTKLHALEFASFLLYQLGEWQGAQEHARQMQVIAEAHGFAAFLDDALTTLVCAGVRGGTETILEKVYDRLIASKTSSTTTRWLICRIMLADAASAIGDTARALVALDSIPLDLRDVICAPEIRRIRGEVLRRQDQRDEAGRSFREAIAIARSRSERSFELRATTSLARLLAGQDRGREARLMLTEIYGWFTEGFDTLDLRAARTLLAELESMKG